VCVRSETGRAPRHVDGSPRVRGTRIVFGGRRVNVLVAVLVLSRGLVNVVAENGPVCLVGEEASCLLV